MSGSEHDRLTRERLLRLGLALPAAAVLTGGGSSAAAPVVLRATPSCDDGDEPTEQQTEGPYYTPSTPRRRNLRASGIPGVPLVLTGRVLTTRCRPVKGALLDFWQADGRGAYDNEGFKLRGHQFTDASGRFRLDTVYPGLYPGRTRHIHVKVQAPRGPVLTTQLYFPGVASNRSDGIFDSSLLVALSKARSPWAARFDFVVES